MRNNTPPQSPYRNLEEEIIEAEDGEVIYFDDEEQALAAGSEDEDADDANDAQYEEMNLEDIEGMLGQRIPERDDAKITFREHSSAVFSCHLHPTENIAVTGGEDDKAFVWNTETGEVISKIEGHKDTVISVAFSPDGNYLATGDMAGEIQVFKVAQNYKKVWEFSMGDMCWMKWHMAANVLLAGSEVGDIYVWRIPSGDCKILPGNGNRCETAELANDGKKLFVGYGDGCVKLWDIKNTSALVEVRPNEPISHSECVSGVSCDPERNLYMSGSEDGKIMLVSNSGPVAVLDPEAGPVEVVAFCPDTELRVAASGTLRGQIAIWDIAKQSIRATCEHSESDNGVTTLKWLPDQTLVCGTILGNVIAFDGRSGTRKYELQGHGAEVYDMCYDRAKGLLLCASEDSTAKIFQINH